MFKQVRLGWLKAIQSIQNSVNMGPTLFLCINYLSKRCIKHNQKFHLSEAALAQWIRVRLSFCDPEHRIYGFSIYNVVVMWKRL